MIILDKLMDVLGARRWSAAIAEPGIPAPPRGAPRRGTVIPVVWGTHRCRGVMLAQGSPSTGSALASILGGSSIFASLAPVIVGICQGPIAGTVQRVHRDHEAAALPNALAHIVGESKTYAITYASPSAYTDGIAYEGIVQFRTDGLTLDASGGLPSLEWEVQGREWVTGDADALPWDVAEDIVTDHTVGLGRASSDLVYATGLDGAASSSWQRWCQVHGFRVSRAVEASVSARSLLHDLATATASALSYSEGAIKFVPLGDTTVSGNGYTWTPPAPVAIGVGSILREPGEDPVQITRRPESETYNLCVVSFTDRALDYDENTIDYLDAAHASTHGIREAPVVRVPWVTTAAHAHKLAQLMVRRSLYQRNTARFRLPPTFGHIEPGDIVTLTDGHMLASASYRIVMVDENERGELEIEALEWGSGASIPMALSVQAATPTALTAFSDQSVVSRTYRQSTQPSGVPLYAGDLWYNSDEGHKLYRYNGSTWDATIVGTAALSDAAVTNPKLGTAVIAQANLTSGASANLWPNPSSESAPPSGASSEVLNSAEFAYRSTAAAYRGSYGRSLVNGDGVSVEYPIAGGSMARFAASMKSSGGQMTPKIAISFYESGSWTEVTSFSTSSTDWVHPSSGALVSALAPTWSTHVRFSLSASGTTGAGYLDLLDAQIVDALSVFSQSKNTNTWSEVVGAAWWMGSQAAVLHAVIAYQNHGSSAVRFRINGPTGLAVIARWQLTQGQLPSGEVVEWTTALAGATSDLTVNCEADHIVMLDLKAHMVPQSNVGIVKLEWAGSSSNDLTVMIKGGRCTVTSRP